MPALQTRGETHLVGRAEVLAEAKRLLHGAPGGRTPILLLIGATGVGKSTFVREVIREEREQGVLVLEGRALPMDLPQPYFVLQEALRNLPSARQQAELPDPTSASAGVAGIGIGGLPTARERRSLVPLGMLPFEDEQESSQVRETRLLDALSGDAPSVEESRMELLDGLASHLEEVASESPLLLVLEDLHHADEGSLEFVSFVAQRGRVPTLRLLLTSLPEPEMPPAVRVHLEGLAKEGLVHRLELRAMTEAEAADYVHVLAGEHRIQDSKITKWHTLTEGNPLFLEQLVRGELGAFGEEDRRETSVLTELPRGEELRQVLRQRLREMKEPERRALSYASVLGGEFSFPLLHRASGMEEEALAESVEALVRRGLLREKGGERYEFVQEELRGEVYTSMTEVRRGLLHRKVAETLEKEIPKDGSPDPRLVYELARHWYIGQVDEKALLYNLKAAELDKQAVAPATAAGHLERALEAHRRLHPDDGARETELAIELALQLDASGDVPQALRVLEAMRLRAYAPGGRFPVKEQARLSIHMAKLLTHSGEMLRALPHTDEALSVLGPDGDPQLRGHAYRLRGTVEFYRGRYRESEAEYARSRACFDQSSTPLERARSKISLANVKSMASLNVPVPEIERLYREAIDELEEGGDFGEAATAANNLALLYMERTTLDQAIRAMDDALRLAERSQDARMIGWCEFNMADLKLRVHDLESAERLNQRARERLVRTGDKIAMIQVDLNDGRLKMARGEFGPAELSMLEAYRLAREVTLEPDELEVIFRLAQLSVARKDYPSALQKLDELHRRDFPTIRPDMMPEMRELLSNLELVGHPAPGWDERPEGPAAQEAGGDAPPG